MRNAGLVNLGLTCDAITLKNACAIGGEKGVSKVSKVEIGLYAAAEVTER